jgi:hypothetical protein
MTSQTAAGLESRNQLGKELKSCERRRIDKSGAEQAQISWNASRAQILLSPENQTHSWLSAGRCPHTCPGVPLRLGSELRATLKQATQPRSHTNFSQKNDDSHFHVPLPRHPCSCGVCIAQG